MGLLQNGQWVDKWYDTKSTGGNFVRTTTQFRNWITKDGSAGPTGTGGFKAESGRYHLYISLACPWASRTLIMRALKGLETHISLSVVHPLMLENGWTFEEADGVIADSELNSNYLYQVYLAAKPDYSGRVTVPVLWDKKTKTIVNNESAEIMRIFNSAFDEITGNTEDYYPTDLQADIDQMNDFVYPNINNGVYKAGFSTSQTVYEKEVKNLFSALHKLEVILSSQNYLIGNHFTEADIRFSQLLFVLTVFIMAISNAISDI